MDLSEDSSRKKGRRSRTLGPTSSTLPSLFETEELPAQPTPLPVPDLPVGNLEWLERTTEDPDGVERAHPRKRFRKGLRVTINGVEYHCHGVDVSRGGIGFQPVPAGAKKGDPVLIELDEPPFRLLGRIAWYRPLEDGTDNLFIGVRFSRPLDESLDGEED